MVHQISKIALDTPGVRDAVAFAGFSGATRANNPNVAGSFVQMDDARDRAKRGLQSQVVLADMRKRMSQIEEAAVFVLQPPPVRGIGNAGGFRLQVQDRGGRGLSTS